MKKIFIHIVSLILTLGLVLNAQASALNLSLGFSEIENSADFSAEKECLEMINTFSNKKSKHQLNASFEKVARRCEDRLIESFFESYIRTTFLELHILHESFLL